MNLPPSLNRFPQYLAKLFIISLLWACSGTHLSMQESSRLTPTDPQTALEQISKIKPADRDLALYQLNLGYLHLITKNYPQAISALGQVQKISEELNSISLTESTAASTINENARSYLPPPFERIMAQNMLILAYILSNNWDSARIEMKRTQTVMRELKGDSQTRAQLVSNHLISAMIYFYDKEFDNALISFRMAHNVLEAHKLQTPPAIQAAIIQLSAKVGAPENIARYQKIFKLSDQQAQQYRNNSQHSEFTFHFNGVVDVKVAQTIPIPNSNTALTVSLPYYPKSPDTPKQWNSLILIEDYNQLARDALMSDYPAILAAATVRVLAKNKLADEIGNKDPLLGMLTNLGTVASEQADIRNWSTLPQGLYFNYTPRANQTEKPSSVLRLSFNQIIMPEITF